MITYPSCIRLFGGLHHNGVRFGVESVYYKAKNMKTIYIKEILERYEIRNRRIAKRW